MRIWFSQLTNSSAKRQLLLGFLTRTALALICAAVTALNGQPAHAVIISALLLVTASVSLAHHPTHPQAEPRRWPLVLESAAAALVISAFGTAGAGFMPYLLAPVATTGLGLGLGVATASFGSATVIVLLAPLLLAPARLAGEIGEPALTRPVMWLPLIGGAALVAGWSRQLQTDGRSVVEPAYTDAHRLLSELHLVARQLSLGLDPHTLATALVEELQTLTDGARATVLIRSAAGRFVPVVGDPPSPLTESAVLDAWVSADLVRRGRSGVTVVALPVLMGARVVAVVVLTDSTGSPTLDDESVQACRTAITQAGPRLASALLFDDVRRLATVDERHRLAREIHDGIAQDMASVGYQIDDIASDAPREVGRRLHDLREHLTNLVSELRLSIFDLRAGVDESVGLSRTVSDYVQRVGAKAGLVVHTSADESPHRLPLATEVELLRIVQEAVTNVRRHAYASNLWVTIVVDPPNAHLIVADDGRGLGTPRPDSMGITGMHERATRIGAQLTVQNRTNAPGTIVELELCTDALSTRSTQSSTPSTPTTPTTPTIGRLTTAAPQEEHAGAGVAGEGAS